MEGLKVPYLPLELLILISTHLTDPCDLNAFMKASRHLHTALAPIFTARFPFPDCIDMSYANLCRYDPADAADVWGVSVDTLTQRYFLLRASHECWPRSAALALRRGAAVSSTFDYSAYAYWDTCIHPIVFAANTHPHTLLADQLATIRLLIANGADVAKDSTSCCWGHEMHGWHGTALQVAAFRSNLPLLRLLVEELAIPIDNGPWMHDLGNPPLGLALNPASGVALPQRTATIQYLLSQRISKENLECCHPNDETPFRPLVQAVRCGYGPEIVSMLLAAGCDPNHICDSCNQDECVTDNTALHHVVYIQPSGIPSNNWQDLWKAIDTCRMRQKPKSDLVVCELLLRAGADPSAMNSKDQTPLDMARLAEERGFGGAKEVRRLMEMYIEGREKRVGTEAESRKMMRKGLMRVESLRF